MVMESPPRSNGAPRSVKLAERMLLALQVNALAAAAAATASDPVAADVIHENAELLADEFRAFLQELESERGAITDRLTVAHGLLASKDVLPEALTRACAIVREVMAAVGQEVVA